MRWFSLCFVVACTGDPAATDPVTDTELDTDVGVALDPETVELAGDCGLDDRWGGFLVENQEMFAIVDGEVIEGVVPVAVLVEVSTEGDCRLLRRDTPFCDPACTAGETCDHSGECVSYPASVDLGTASISGLLVDVSMEPSSPGARYFDTTVPNPVFEPGALLELRTERLDPLHGVGVQPLTAANPVWVISADTPLEVSWDAPEGAVRSQVRLDLTVDQHGVSPLALRCLFDDDGAGTVPAALIEGLTTAGVTGFPNGRIARRTVDSTALDSGCVDFTVASRLEAEVEVAGYTPCDGPDDCPEGLECNLAIEACE